MAYRRLPAAPDLDHLKNQAKRLLAAFREGDPAATADFSVHHPDGPSPAEAKLTHAQFVLARTYGQSSFPRLLTMARIQRALHDNDVDALQSIVAEDPDALRSFSEAHSERPRPRMFSASRRVNRENVHAFLRGHAPDLPVEDLELLPGGRHGDGMVLQYGPDRIVKVPKNGTRKALLKEQRILGHLAGQDLPISVPEPLFVHEKGFYAVYRAPAGLQLSPDTLSDLGESDLETAIRSIARFFHVVHTHPFPAAVLAHVPVADDGYDVAPGRMRRKVAFIAEHSTAYDTDRWLEELDRLEPSLNQRWALTQCDPQPGFFTAVGGDLTKLCMGSFYDSARHDPAIDLHDFILEVRSDMEDEKRIEQISTWIVDHYPGDDPDLAAKVDFGLMGYEVRWAHIRVRAEVRAQEKDA